MQSLEELRKEVRCRAQEIHELQTFCTALPADFPEMLGSDLAKMWPAPPITDEKIDRARDAKMLAMGSYRALIWLNGLLQPEEEKPCQKRK